MAGLERKGGKKNRKFGRKKRRPSHNRYNSSERWLKNKAKKIAKQMKKFKKYKPYGVSHTVMGLVKKLLAS